MDENNLELNESIQKIGIQEPLLVRPIHHSRREEHGLTYELIDGRARIGAAIKGHSLSDKGPGLGGQHVRRSDSLTPVEKDLLERDRACVQPETDTPDEHPPMA